MADLLSYGIDVDAAVYQLRDVGLPDLVRRSKRYTEYLAVLLEPVCDRIDVVLWHTKIAGSKDKRRVETLLL